VLGQETLRADDELGKDSLVHTCPPSVVVSADAPLPTAVHTSSVGQEMDKGLKADVTSWLCHTFPPSVVARTTPSAVVVEPITQQSDLSAHEMPSRLPMPLGTYCALQASPAVLVRRIAAPLNVEVPTARHSDALGHTTSARLTPSGS
jgi:hypothetical protein